MTTSVASCRLGALSREVEGDDDDDASSMGGSDRWSSWGACRLRRRSGGDSGHLAHQHKSSFAEQSNQTFAEQHQRFLSRAVWRTLADLAGRLMRRYIELGARTGWFAERALAFEQARTLHIVRMDYVAPQLRDITGADLLEDDLTELDATRTGCCVPCPRAGS
jgi:hypothetical protein